MSLTVEIKNVGFVNKGAELMLLSVVSQVKMHYPDARFVMSCQNGEYEKKIAVGVLYQKMEYSISNIDFSDFFLNIIPKSVRMELGLVMNKEIDVVFDAAGFAYSDQRSIKNAVRTASLYKKWKKAGKKIILLPQAFGPFENAVIQKAVREIVLSSTVVFVRDGTSYRYLVELLGRKANVLQAPDFTNILQTNNSVDIDANKYDICIIPNYRMIDQLSSVESSKYIPLMQKISSYLLEQNRNPFLLVHEGHQDMKLAHDINKGLTVKLKIITESDPLKIKGILGQCEAVIGSRFHGLVSSLCQGVPCLATGWSHKYQELFNDYNFPDGLLELDVSDEQLYRKISQIIDKVENFKLRKKLNIESEKLKQETKNMWKNIFTLIDE